MLFDNQKKVFLKKSDKSKKGGIDKEIKQLVKKINSSKDYYTTSSCAGRIVLLEKKSDKKQEIKWLFKKHGKVNFKEIKNSLKKLSKHDIWFRQEAAILHVACKTINNTQKLINLARSIGFKRSGIQSTKNKIIVEIASSDYIDTIIAKKGKLLVDNDLLKILISEANKKLKRNKEKLKKLMLGFLS